MAADLVVRNNVEILVWDGLGPSAGSPLIRRIEAKNLIVKKGRQLIRDLLGYPQLGGSGFSPDYLAVGTGGSSVSDNDTALQVEIYRGQISIKKPLDQGVQWQFFLPTTLANGTGTSTLTEAGLFDLPTGGSLFARFKHTPITKTSAVSVTYNWTWTIGAS